MSATDPEWYSVHVEMRAPTGTPDLAVDENAAAALMDILEEQGGVVSYGPVPGGRPSASRPLTPATQQASRRSVRVAGRDEQGHPGQPLVPVWTRTASPAVVI